MSPKLTRNKEKTQLQSTDLNIICYNYKNIQSNFLYRNLAKRQGFISRANFENSLTYFQSGMDHYFGRGRPYGGIGWIVRDFNSDPWRNKTYDKQLVDFLIEKDLNCLEKNFENKITYTYTNGLYYSCIDHVVGSSHEEAMIEGIRILEPDLLNLSDHLPEQTKIQVATKKNYN
ncbi:hypothetical protein BpHYR1_034344, partial [Brachionus plicatilis]